MKKILLTTSLCLFILSSNAQYSFETYNQGTDIVSVIEDNKTLNNPFAGGLDVPQFSTIDLDFDGKKDLVIFDREGSRLSTYLNKGSNNTISYEYAPEYVKAFPKISDWLYIIDYNGDGKEDLFTAIPGGFRVYKNIGGNAQGLVFEDTFPEVDCDYTSIKTRLYVGNTDLPAILDVDEDGDIDLLTFYLSIDSSGESIYWYKNMSVERYGNKDSMDFIVGKYCWGKFRESYTDCNINLNYPVGICGNGGKFIPNISPEEFKKKLFERIEASSGPQHSGSTTLVFDANGDSKYDMLIGDVTCNNMYLVVNGTDNQNPVMIQNYKNYPPNHPIILETFPAAFHLDVNNDGLKDLIATVNTSNASLNNNHVQLYLNDGTNSVNAYQHQSDNFMLSDMVDVGEGSSPEFVDYNNDGLLDIVISNTGYWQGSGVYKTGLALYKNIGSQELAKYELVSRDWMNFSILNIANMAPSFADLDNDGDLDMICGASDGTLHFFRNNAGPNTSLDLQYIANYFGTIDVGNFSTPFVYDFNGDGKKEIVVGERLDNINLFENIGDNVNPNYSLVTDSLYQINMRKFASYPSGRGRLTIKSLRPNENPRVIVSNGNATIYILDYFDADHTKAINVAVDSIKLNAGNFSNANGGFYYSLEDINNDQKPEVLVGAPQGGLYLLRNTSLNVGIDKEVLNDNISIFPNPSSDVFYVQSKNNDIINRVQLIDLNGRIIEEYNNSNTFYQIDTKELTEGMYFVKIEMQNASITKKVVKN